MAIETIGRRELAELWGCTPSFIDNLVQSGELIKVGRNKIDLQHAQNFRATRNPNHVIENEVRRATAKGRGMDDTALASMTGNASPQQPKQMPLPALGIPYRSDDDWLAYVDAMSEKLSAAQAGLKALEQLDSDQPRHRAAATLLRMRALQAGTDQLVARLESLIADQEASDAMIDEVVAYYLDEFEQVTTAG